MRSRMTVNSNDPTGRGFVVPFCKAKELGLTSVVHICSRERRGYDVGGTPFCLLTHDVTVEVCTFPTSTFYIDYNNNEGSVFGSMTFLEPRRTFHSS